MHDTCDAEQGEAVRFSQAPVGSVLAVGYTADGPVLAKKLEDAISHGHVLFNAYWYDTLTTCVIMDDQECEVVLPPKPVEPRSAK